MMTLFGLFSGASAAAAPAAATAATAATTAATTAGGLSISQILGGTATLLSAVSSIAAGNAQGDALEAQARDAQDQKPLELLQGLQRKNDIKRATMQAVAEIDTTTAASGTDLTYGTPVQARKAAFNEGDSGLNTNANTTGATLDRLDLRNKEYLKMARNARTAGLFDGFVTGLSGFSRLYDTRKPV